MDLIYEQYLDKVLGGWAGKSAGGILGAPIEGFKVFNSLVINDDLFATNVPNDDLDLQILWLDLIHELKRPPESEEMAAHWLKHVGFPWNEYGIATRNLQIGLLPPQSGLYNNQYWKHSMGCPIRSELWGMVFPGMPEWAAKFAKRDAMIDHAGFSVDAEVFLAACAAICFEEKDLISVMQRAIRFVEKESMMASLYKDVSDWYHLYGFDVCRGKIKSRYGDADFTSAPMNIGFTILSLFDCKGSIEGITTGLHIGHDSDCIVASAGALIGICMGYNAFPETWKRRIGDNIVISDALTVSLRPSTLKELTELTYHALHYMKQPSPSKVVLVTHDILNWTDDQFQHVYRVKLEFLQEILPSMDVMVRLQSDSIHIEEHSWKFQLRNGVGYKNEIDIRPNLKGGFPKYELVADVWVDGVLFTRHLIVLPYYGSWLALGPFIEHDTSLIPCDTEFPDHGNTPLPSVQYMNHDLSHSKKEWLSPSDLELLYSTGSLNFQPFDVTMLHCSSFSVPILFAKGKGERTIYLYTQLQLENAMQLWMSMGCTCKLTIWVNRIMVYENDSRKRNWPGAHTISVPFEVGINSIIIRLDMMLDIESFQIGFKHFEGKHPHQTCWSPFTPFVQDKSIYHESV